MMIKFGDLEGCVDCLAFVANGTVPEDRPELPLEIWKQWGEHASQIVDSCPDGCEGHFSRSACQICGSRFAGERHPFVVLGEE